ncbi:GroES-like protein [Viridothelium virens]|uniref:GroES-like protein n=1 Tax=Viridothelium virens TaxID=1048519 RepID=A0A6A6HF94_VIRVR|nr:GroES-like protein [Viridothelium virens]
MAFSSEAYVAKEPGGPITLETIQYDGVGKNELVVETVAFSMCASDLKAAQGVFHLKPPIILGHESAGIVRQAGSAVSHLRPGDQIVLSYSHCRKCRYCLQGEAPYCENITALNFSGRRSDGSVAAHDALGRPMNHSFFGQSSMGRVALVHESCAHKVECTLEELKKFAALGCGIQTGLGAILNVCKPPPLSSIAIFGAGTVGIAAALAARLTFPSRVVVIDTASNKLSMIPEGVATSTLSSAGLQEGEIADKLKAMTEGRGFDYVVDCVGLAQLVNAGHQALAPRGMVVTIGGPPETASISLAAQLLGGRTYRGSHQGDSVPSTSIPMMIDLWRKGHFPFDKLLSFYRFNELEKAILDLKAGKIFKPVFVINDN